MEEDPEQMNREQGEGLVLAAGLGGSVGWNWSWALVAQWILVFSNPDSSL